MISFDNIVKKLSQLSGTLVTTRDMTRIIAPTDGLAASPKVYTVISRLRLSGFLLPIKSGLFVVGPLPKFHITSWVDHNYWSIAQKVISDRRVGTVIILWKKALELHLKDTLPPNRLILAVSAGRSVEMITASQSIVFTPLTSGKRSEGISLWKYVLAHSKKQNIDGIDFLIACPEIALLDALTLRDKREGIDRGLIKKFLARFHDRLDESILSELVRYKYIVALNRLRVLSRELGYPDVYELSLRVIQISGANCFVSEEKLWV